MRSPWESPLVMREYRENTEEIMPFCREHLAAYKVPNLAGFRDLLLKSAGARCCGTKRRQGGMQRKGSERP